MAYFQGKKPLYLNVIYMFRLGLNSYYQRRPSVMKLISIKHNYVSNAVYYAKKNDVLPTICQLN